MVHSIQRGAHGLDSVQTKSLCNQKALIDMRLQLIDRVHALGASAGQQRRNSAGEAADVGDNPPREVLRPPAPLVADSDHWKSRIAQNTSLFVGAKINCVAPAVLCCLAQFVSKS